MNVTATYDPTEEIRLSRLCIDFDSFEKDYTMFALMELRHVHGVNEVEVDTFWTGDGSERHIVLESICDNPSRNIIVNGPVVHSFSDLAKPAEEVTLGRSVARLIDKLVESHREETAIRSSDHDSD